MIKVGILGLGKMGKLHFLNLIHMRSVKVTAAADREKATSKWLGLSRQHLQRL